MADVYVRQSALLRQYATMLQRFGDSQKALIIGLQRDIDKRKDSLNTKIHKMDRAQESLSEKVNELSLRYDDVRRIVDTPSAVLLGNSDEEAAILLQKYSLKMQEVIGKIRRVMLVMDELQSKGMNYSTNVDSLTHSGALSLIQQADLIDNYKSK